MAKKKKTRNATEKKTPMPAPDQDATADEVIQYIEWGLKNKVFKKKAGRAKLFALFAYLNTVAKIDTGS